MLNELINGIAAKLGAIFGSACTIYTEQETQGFVGPCFFIALKEASRGPAARGPVYQQAMTIAATYYPGTGGGHAEMRSVGNQLLECMEEISLENGDRIRGHDLKFRIEENVLNFSVNYRCRLLKEMEQTQMETMDAKMGIQR